MASLHLIQWRWVSNYSHLYTPFTGARATSLVTLVSRIDFVYKDFPYHLYSRKCMEKCVQYLRVKYGYFAYNFFVVLCCLVNLNSLWWNDLSPPVEKVQSFTIHRHYSLWNKKIKWEKSFIWVSWRKSIWDSVGVLIKIQTHRVTISKLTQFNGTSYHSDMLLRHFYEIDMMMSKAIIFLGRIHGTTESSAFIIIFPGLKTALLWVSFIGDSTNFNL